MLDVVGVSKTLRVGEMKRSYVSVSLLFVNSASSGDVKNTLSCLLPQRVR